MLSECSIQKHGSILTLFSGGWYVNNIDMNEVQGTCFALPAMATINDELRTPMKLIFTVLKSSTVSFSLPFAIGEGALRQLFGINVV